MTVSLLAPMVLRLKQFSEWTVNLYCWQVSWSSPTAGVSTAESESVRDVVAVPDTMFTDVTRKVTSSPSRAKPDRHDSLTPRPLTGSASKRLEGGDGSPAWRDQATITNFHRGPTLVMVTSDLKEFHGMIYFGTFPEHLTLIMPVPYNYLQHRHHQQAEQGSGDLFCVLLMPVLQMRGWLARLHASRRAVQTNLFFSQRLTTSDRAIPLV